MIDLNGVRIVVGYGAVETTFSDGLVVYGDFSEQPGQAETATSVGMTVIELNRTHDVAHSLLAYMLGLDHSPTLRAVAEGSIAECWELEEAAVLAIQAFASNRGIDIVAQADRLTSHRK